MNPHCLPRRTLLAASAAAAALPRLARAAEVPIKFRWDWIPQGYHGIWALADERGLFRAEGLTVSQDPGAGSGDTIVKVASGTYDVGFADVNSLVKFNAEHPNDRVIAVCMVYNRLPAAVVTLKRTGIKTGMDLAGRNLGSPDGEAGRVLFPLYAAAIGLDPASVHWTSMVASMRETMLMTGQIDAAAGFQMSEVMSLRAMGVKAEDIVAFSYADAGVDLYGSSIIVRADWAQRNPGPLRGFVRATIGGVRAAVNDPDAAIAALKKREPLMDSVIELERWQLTERIAVVTDDVRTNGIGTMIPERMAKLVAVNAGINHIAEPPAPELMYSNDYLPPMADRRL